MEGDSVPETKLPLPVFLQMLTSNNVPASKAMAVASKIYKTHSAPSALAQLNELKLSAAGVDDKELRKLVLSAIRKAGYKPTHNTAAKPRPKKKRKRDDDLNEFLPSGPQGEAETNGSLEFNEVLDEETKFAVVNRAPIMTAWAFIVAERLGFQREEALSIASVYTEMNAITKGISLGKYEENRGKGMEASKGGSQPYVDLMGRRIPLYQTASSQWRALSKGAPVAPSEAFSYITRALRQTAPHILGALRLLAASYPPGELDKAGYSLYADFRPNAEGWGQRSEVRCATILDLRKKGAEAEEEQPTPAISAAVVKTEPGGGDPAATTSSGESDAKKQRTMTVEEYEAALDADAAFDYTFMTLEDSAS
ncbi:hypothetical protein OBBRIDRAFT_198789 [Obba rivulosa]|uniref:Uncharacterized protein n=1 Tax=Obba rivulosa TaxID=1052685 RepID=A0A8E2DR44_9APHY|nr:hypothetical protein OBBRIDRAFT_198789 [Obba rivulosa]